MKHLPRYTAPAALIGTLLLAAGLSGCSTADQKHNTQLAEIRSHPSPALLTRTDRPTDLHNDWVYKRDTDTRMIIEDLKRVMHLDRPTRMFPGPRPF